MICIILLTFGFISNQRFYLSIRRRDSLPSLQAPPLVTVISIGLVSLRSILKLWDRVSEQSRLEVLIFSILERVLPTNHVEFVGVFPGNLTDFVGALPEHLLHDAFLPLLVIHGETQSFLRPPWPGDYDIDFIVHLLPSKSGTASRVHRRTCVHEETMFGERNLCVLQVSLSTGLFDIYQDLFGAYNLSEMVSQIYEGIDVNFSLEILVRLFGYWKPSWHRRVSMHMSGWCKWLIYRSCKKSIIESTLIQRTRIRTNWYRVDAPNTMRFYCMIWKTNKMPIRHTYHIRARQVMEKENNRSHVLLAYVKK
ncbi:hypothetical protein YC2023_064362 [Brassica napus]